MKKRNAAMVANKTLDSLDTFAKNLSLLMVAIMTIIVFVGVVARYVFNAPLLWVDEYTTYLMASVCLVGANYVLKENGHINVDFFLALLKPKTRAWVTAVFDVISMFCLVMILIQVTNVTISSFESHSMTITIMRTPLGLVQLMMPIGFGLLLLEFMRVTVKSFKQAIGLSRPGRPR
jgi:TRAP-type C4-dicarboxylate transport system permease small subunit